MKSVVTNPWTIITFCLVLPITAYSIMKWYEVFYEEPVRLGTVTQTSLPGFRDQHNSPANNIFKGKLTVVNFFFTSCPVICPKMMKNVNFVHDRYADDPNIRFVSISVDPERDNQERLQWYISKMHIDDKGWQLIHGDKSTTHILARNQFNLVAADANENSDFIHSDKVILVDTAGNIRGYYSGLDKPEMDKLIIDIKKLKS